MAAEQYDDNLTKAEKAKILLLKNHPSNFDVGSLFSNDLKKSMGTHIRNMINESKFYSYKDNRLTLDDFLIIGKAFSMACLRCATICNSPRYRSLPMGMKIERNG